MTGARTDQYTNRDDGYWGVWQLLNLAREMRGGLTLDGFDVKPLDIKKTDLPWQLPISLPQNRTQLLRFNNDSEMLA